MKPQKVIGVITEDELVLAKDTDQYFVTDGMYLFDVKKGVSIDYLMGICNSSLFVYLYRLLAMEKGRVMAQVKPTVIEALPVADFDKKRNESVQIQKLSISIQGKFLKLKAEKNGQKRKKLFDEIQSEQQQIDQFVMDLYRLTQSDRQMINKALGVSSERIKKARKKVQKIGAKTMPAKKKKSFKKEA